MKSDMGWISAHCDGGARGNPGPAGYGAVIVDESGAVVAELSEFLGDRTNNYAEYSGLLGCLGFALKHGYDRLRVVSDSELMVKQIQGKYQVRSPDLKPLYDEAKRWIAQLAGFEISHALRHKNKDADRLANEAMDRGTGRGSTARVDAGASDGGGGTTKPTRQSPALRDQTSSNPRGTASARGASLVSAPGPGPSSNGKADAMLRGFTRDGVVHILGGKPLPDGIFVKILRE